MTIQVYIAQDYTLRFCIYSAVSHAMLDTRTFQHRWQATRAAELHGWRE